MPRTSPYHIELTGDERNRLEVTARRYSSPHRDVARAKIVLLAAEGLPNDEIAARLDTPLSPNRIQMAQTFLRATLGWPPGATTNRTAPGFSPRRWS
jgi:hypothetical protein